MCARKWKRCGGDEIKRMQKISRRPFVSSVASLRNYHLGKFKRPRLFRQPCNPEAVSVVPYRLYALAAPRYSDQGLLWPTDDRRCRRTTLGLVDGACRPFADIQFPTPLGDCSKSASGHSPSTINSTRKFDYLAFSTKATRPACIASLHSTVKHKWQAAIKVASRQFL